MLFEESTTKEFLERNGYRESPIVEFDERQIWTNRYYKDEIIEAHIAAQVNKDYFVEEIKANIIYHDKVFPLIGMVAGQVARGVGQAGKKVGGKLLQDIGDVSQGMMQQEEEEQ